MQDGNLETIDVTVRVNTKNGWKEFCIRANITGEITQDDFECDNFLENVMDPIGVHLHEAIYEAKYGKLTMMQRGLLAMAKDAEAAKVL